MQPPPFPSETIADYTSKPDGRQGTTNAPGVSRQMAFTTGVRTRREKRNKLQNSIKLTPSILNPSTPLRPPREGRVCHSSLLEVYIVLLCSNTLFFSCSSFNLSSTRWGVRQPLLSARGHQPSSQTQNHTNYRYTTHTHTLFSILVKKVVKRKKQNLYCCYDSPTTNRIKPKCWHLSFESSKFRPFFLPPPYLCNRRTSTDYRL